VARRGKELRRVAVKVACRIVAYGWEGPRKWAGNSRPAPTALLYLGFKTGGSFYTIPRIFANFAA